MDTILRYCTIKMGGESIKASTIAPLFDSVLAKSLDPESLAKQRPVLHKASKFKPCRAIHGWGFAIRHASAG